MPGTILAVNVKPGDVVKKGDVLLILEAMKMENEIVAPRDGKILTVNVAKGSSVNVGEVFLTIGWWNNSSYSALDVIISMMTDLKLQGTRRWIHNG